MTRAIPPQMRVLRRLRAVVLSGVVHAAAWVAIVVLAPHGDGTRGGERAAPWRQLLDPATLAVEAPAFASVGESAATPLSAPLREAAGAPRGRPDHDEGAEAARAVDAVDAVLPSGGVDLDDVGGLRASLKQRLARPLLNGFAHLADREGPGDSLFPPYPVVSDGRIAKERIRNSVRGISHALAACGAKRTERGDVRMAVTFEVGRAGQVVSALDLPGGTGDADARACVVKLFYGLTFPPPERGSAHVTYPVHLPAMR